MSCSIKSTWVRRLSPCLILLAMSACATVSTVPVNSYCAVARPISYDNAKDTPETVRTIEAHNSTWVCLCESDCPAGVTP